MVYLKTQVHKNPMKFTREIKVTGAVPEFEFDYEVTEEFLADNLTCTNEEMYEHLAHMFAAEIASKIKTEICDILHKQFVALDAVGGAGALETNDSPQASKTVPNTGGLVLQVDKATIKSGCINAKNISAGNVAYKNPGIYPEVPSLSQACAALTEHVSYPKELGLEGTARLGDIIMHLNDSEKWSREQIADWLETLDIDISIDLGGNDETQQGN